MYFHKKQNARQEVAQVAGYEAAHGEAHAEAHAESATRAPQATRTIHISRYPLACAAGVIIGVCIASFTEVAALHATIVGLVALAAAFVTASGSRVQLLCILGVGVAAGALRIGIIKPYVNQYDLYQEFQGVVIQQPELRVDSQRLVVRSAAIDGDILVTVPLQPRYQPGQLLGMSCMLRKPEAFDGFAYDKYLERYGIGSTCRYPRIEVRGTRHTAITRLLTGKLWLAARVKKVMPPPEHTIILGALFGEKRAIPDEVAQAFRTTGTSHVLVISGMHVSLLSAMVAQLLAALGLRRSHISAMVIAFLAVYVVATGVQASALRASLFGTTALIATLVGRPRQSLHLLLLIAAGLLLWQPLLLLHDAGFQLSVLATAGIIIFEPVIEARLTVVPSAFSLRATVATSIAAMVTTTPLIAHSFNTLSLVALLANTLVVPWMPVILSGAVATTLLSALSLPLAQLIALPLYYLLHSMIAVVQWCANIPYAALEVHTFSTSLLVISFAFITYLSWKALQKNY